MKEKVMLIVNPSSGDEQALAASGALVKVLGSTYSEITVVFTQGQGDAQSFAKRACEENYQAVFCLGGDGTVYEVINGLGPYEDAPSLGVLPMGTVNNYARMLGMPMNMEEAVQVFADPQLIRSDIGQVNDRYFVSTVSTGTLPQSATQVSVEQKTNLGPLAYVVEGLSALQEENLSRFRIKLDGQDLDNKYSLVVIGLGNSVFGLPNFFKDASLTDGKLHFLGLKDTTILEKLSIVPEIFRKGDYTSEGVVSLNFKEAEISLESGEDLGTAVDGEKGPDFPLYLKILEAKQKVFVPRKLGQGGEDEVKTSDD